MISLNDIERLLSPWQSAYSDSTLLSTGVTALHLIGMLVGGGLALAADRTTLRISEEAPGKREWHLGELNAIHRPVLLALTLLFVTGIAMIAADVKTFVTSPVLWVKLTLVALLVANGVVLERTETALRRTSDSAPQGASEKLWSRLRVSAICSIAVWLATLVAGVFLVNAA
ncbi:MAG: hypothetical protein ABI556_12225 [Gemmatimonadales bacterium]